MTRDDLLHRAQVGACNLLVNCVGLQAGQALLLVEEDPGLDYFDGRAGRIIADEARRIGGRVLGFSTPRAAGPDDVPAALTAAMEHVDHTVFLNRIGDQMRFRSLLGAGSKTMVYTLDAATLASRAAGYDHRAMVRLIEAFNADMAGRKTWRVTCPAGTDVAGQMPSPAGDAGGFAVRLFPMSVHRPVPAETMRGRIVLQRWVTGTNTHAYSSEVHYLKSPITVQVEAGHVTALEGEPADVAAFQAHSRMVAEKLGLDETLIHSWHAGLNPGTGYFARAEDDPVRWNGMIFGSPRHLHFHTCGDYPPGEINWHILDPTVEFDGQRYLEAGQVRFFETAPAQPLLQAFGLSAAAMTTHQDIGL